MLIALGRLADNPRAAITLLLALCIAFIVGIAFHEFSHAFTAYMLGDSTAQSMGRLTLNPIRHLDPFGTLLLFLVGFGWGKPTPVNPYRLRIGPLTGMAVVSAAGPISNFIMATIVAIPLKFGFVTFNDFIPLRDWSFGNYFALLLFYIVVINVVLGIFNLIPIAPLDGAKIAGGILPGEMGDFFRRLEPYGMGILMVLFAISWLSPNLSIFRQVVNPLENRILRVLLG